jgi:hypothetical protein
MSAEQVVDQGTGVTISADGISVIKVGSVTHLIFTLREPQVAEGGRAYQMVQARVIVPNDCLHEVGRAILATNPIMPRETAIDGVSRH